MMPRFCTVDLRENVDIKREGEVNIRHLQESSTVRDGRAIE
jgi:hypothetical protein